MAADQNDRQPDNQIHEPAQADLVSRPSRLKSFSPMTGSANPESRDSGFDANRSLRALSVPPGNDDRKMAV
ncbi:hypothetical protein [Bradyrhizobium sp.]|uniref:hypothetical protein n=1 Tax=Bradyrhizobium sp. TaxID=376 RepID=UPI003C501E38